MKDVALLMLTIAWLSSSEVFAQAVGNSADPSLPSVPAAVETDVSPLPLIDMTLLAFAMASNTDQADYFADMAKARMKRIIVSGRDWEREAVIQRWDLFELVNRSLKIGGTCDNSNATIKGLDLVGNIIDHQNTRDEVALLAVQDMLWKQLLSCRTKGDLRSKDDLLVLAYGDNLPALAQDSLIKQVGDIANQQGRG